MNNFEMTK